MVPRRRKTRRSRGLLHGSARTRGRSPAGIARIALRDTVRTASETEYLGGTGWPGVLAKHGDRDPLSVEPR